MRFAIRLTDSAIEDLDYFRKNERRTISESLELFLSHDADVETKRRKRLRPNRISKWELRIDDYRVFYDIEYDIEGNDLVKVVAVGNKTHNELYIRGEKVEL